MSTLKIYRRFMRRFAENKVKEAEQCRGMSKILHAAKQEGADFSIAVGIDGQYFTVQIAGGNEHSDDLLEVMANFFAGYGYHLSFVASHAVTLASESPEITGAEIAPNGP